MKLRRRADRNFPAQPRNELWPRPFRLLTLPLPASPSRLRGFLVVRPRLLLCTIFVFRGLPWSRMQTKSFTGHSIEYFSKGGRMAADVIGLMQQVVHDAFVARNLHVLHVCHILQIASSVVDFFCCFELSPVAYPRWGIICEFTNKLTSGWLHAFH